MHLRNVIQRHPNTFYISASAASALFGLTMTPTLVPLVLTLTMLLLYAPVLFHRHPFIQTPLLWISISLSSSLGRLVPALNALSTAGPSVAVLLGMSAIASGVAILAIFADVYISSRTGTAQAVLFPAIWTSLWAGISHLPFNLGRLTSWTPMSGTQAYQWMAPWTGPAGIDWVTAGWAVVVSQPVQNWYMGNTDDEIPTEGTSRRPSRAAGTWVLALVLTALTIPSFILFPGPLPVVSSETVSTLTVGCILPTGPSPGIKDYIDESVKLGGRGGGTKLLLWPEGAVDFGSASERQVGFDSIKDRLNKTLNPWLYLGVSFEETIVDPADDSGRTSISHTGIAIFSINGVHKVYHKRYLVPG